ncbi:MAG: hypothetical protein ACRDXD_05510 [Acidimicrobiia bacterium]
MLAAFHNTWGWVAVGLCGLVGLGGIGLRLAGRDPSRPFWVGVALAVGAILVQVGVGFLLLAQGHEPGNLHVFYGLLILFSLTFAYIYRSQLAKRPALAWGLLLLFLMGLGIRAITSFGKNLGLP